MHDWIGCCEASMWLLNNTMTGERGVDTPLCQRDEENRLFQMYVPKQEDSVTKRMLTTTRTDRMCVEEWQRVT